jgi:hypothetical protein
MLSASLLLRDPYHRLLDLASGCGVPARCPDPVGLRRVLRIVIYVLPPRDARALRRRIAELDAVHPLNPHPFLFPAPADPPVW